MTYPFRFLTLLLSAAPLLLDAQVNVPAHQLNSSCMQISPDNSKLAVSLNGVALELILSPFALNFYGGSFQLYDFDNTTGIASNQVNAIPAPSNLLTFDQQVYNVCFSPDNAKLYLTHGLLLGLGLTQYDIISGTPATINASAVELNSTTIGWGRGGFIKGLPAESGSYMFTLSYEKGTEHHRYSIKGDVTLIR